MNAQKRIRLALTTLGVVFSALVISFSLDLWGRVEPVRELPLVDEEFLETETWRRSYADLVKKGDEDELFAFNCYECHEEDKKLELTYDKNNHVVVPEEHENIIMGHGSHGRNNDCFNCHNSENLLTLQTRDGHSLKFEESTQLCGSCHGPTHRDWEDGSHGRTSGHWDRSIGPHHRKDCVNCHDPHSPKFPKHVPAPGPNHLHDNPGITGSGGTATH
jgi:hypothetical protein